MLVEVAVGGGFCAVVRSLVVVPAVERNPKSESCGGHTGSREVGEQHREGLLASNFHHHRQKRAPTWI